MRKIIVGFSKPKAWFKPFSWAIRLAEGTKYSHVYLRAPSSSLDVDLIYQASGAQVNFMGVENFRHHAKAIAEFEAEITDDNYRDFMRWAIISSGAPYSLKQPLGILLVKLFNLSSNPFDNGRYSWVCSELVGFVLSSFLAVEVKESLDTIGPKGIYKLCEKHLKQIEVTT